MTMSSFTTHTSLLEKSLDFPLVSAVTPLEFSND